MDWRELIIGIRKTYSLREFSLSVDEDNSISLATQDVDSAFQIFIDIGPDNVVNTSVYVNGSMIGETGSDPSHTVKDHMEWLKTTLKDLA